MAAGDDLVVDRDVAAGAVAGTQHVVVVVVEAFREVLGARLLPVALAVGLEPELGGAVTVLTGDAVAPLVARPARGLCGRRMADEAFVARRRLDAHVAGDRPSVVGFERAIGARMTVDVGVDPLRPCRLPRVPVGVGLVPARETGAVAGRVAAPTIAEKSRTGHRGRRRRQDPEAHPADQEQRRTHHPHPRAPTNMRYAPPATGIAAAG